MSLPEGMMEQIYYIISDLCGPENNYNYIEKVDLNGLKYKITINLAEVSETLDARTTTITIKRESI